jgi:hypothetical protein
MSESEVPVAAVVAEGEAGDQVAPEDPPATTATTTDVADAGADEASTTAVAPPKTAERPSRPSSIDVNAEDAAPAAAVSRPRPTPIQPNHTSHSPFSLSISHGFMSMRRIRTAPSLAPSQSIMHKHVMCQQPVVRSSHGSPRSVEQGVVSGICSSMFLSSCVCADHENSRSLLSTPVVDAAWMCPPFHP